MTDEPYPTPGERRDEIRYRHRSGRRRWPAPATRAGRGNQLVRLKPSWNLAPTDPAPVVYYDAKDGGRRLEVMRWGLIPYWAKDIKIGFSTINARAEEVDTKPAFREAFQRRRCLVPLDGFYEWKKTATGKQPYAIALK
jgi:putative SOS response-associated peptidase YedK